MLMIPRLLRPVAIGLAFGVTMVMMVLFLSENSDDAVASNQPVRTQPAVAQTPKPPNIDGLVAEILERPLFSPSRHPADEAPQEIAQAPNEPPKMPGRLEGVSIRPGSREALFESEGQKPIAVREGQEIEGWTVISIRSDQVLLKSAAGEQTVKPANGAGVKLPQMQAMNKKAMPRKPNILNSPAGPIRPPAQPSRPAVQQPERPAQAGGRTGR